MTLSLRYEYAIRYVIAITLDATRHTYTLMPLTLTPQHYCRHTPLPYAATHTPLLRHTLILPLHIIDAAAAAMATPRYWLRHIISLLTTV